MNTKPKEIIRAAVSLDDWREIVTTAVASAKSGDADARQWLSTYLLDDDPAATGAKVDERLELLLLSWWALLRGRFVTVTDLVLNAEEDGRGADSCCRRDLEECLRYVCHDEQIDRLRLARFIQLNEGVIAGGLRIVKREHYGGQPGPATYRIERVEL